MDRIDEWFAAPCWVIDVLPDRVPDKSPGQYFAVEKYFLQDPELPRKQLRIILKLNCYFDLTLVTEKEETVNPAPEVWAERIGRECLSILAGDRALITTDPGDTYLSVFTADDRILAMIRELAAAEGLFVWKGIDSDGTA